MDCYGELEFEMDDSDYQCENGNKCRYCPLISGGSCKSSYVYYTLHCSVCHHILAGAFARGALRDLLLHYEYGIFENRSHSVTRHLQCCSGVAALRGLYLDIEEDG